MKFANFLISLNDKVYNIKFHSILALTWLMLLNFNFPKVHGWIFLGLALWCVMMLIRWVQDGYSFEKVKDLYEKEGPLPLLVGLNLFVVVNVLCIPLMLFFSYLEKKGK